MAILIVLIKKALFYFVPVVGDSPMIRIMDLPKENINQELSWLRRAAVAAVVSTLPISVYVEPRRPPQRLFGYICVATHISVLSYLFIDP